MKQPVQLSVRPVPSAGSEATPAGRAEAFTALVEGARACRLCAAMEGRRRVLSTLNGRADAPIMVIAEAPGRFGGDVTGVPLLTDASGRHFNALLAGTGIDRDALFITNATLCNPRDEAGRNRKPSRAELANCRGWLRQQINLIGPAVIVTLGVTALDALSSLEAHDYRLRTQVCRPLPWAGRTLIPLYHPSPLSRPWRGDAQQTEDYRWVAEYLRQRGLLPRAEGTLAASALTT